MFFRQREPRLVGSGAESTGNMARELVHPIRRVEREVPIQTRQFNRTVSDKSGWYRGLGSPLFGYRGRAFSFYLSTL